jgi:hypothetical protein
MQSVPARFFFLVAVASASLTGCATLDDIMSEPSPPPAQVLVVHEHSRPVYFDPYYNQPKIYRQPQYFYESTNKKTKGNKVYKTTTVKNQYGQTVYKDTTSRKKKKKK